MAKAVKLTTLSMVLAMGLAPWRSPKVLSPKA